MTSHQPDAGQVPLFTFHLPVRLSPTMIRDMAERAGLTESIAGLSDRGERSIDELLSTEDRAIRNAKWLLDLAKRREKTRWGILFADAGWYILLDLFVREALGKQTSVSSACIASKSPPTTGLRWVTLLVAEGFVRRTNDLNDHRRVLLSLTVETSAELTELLSTVP